MKYGYIRVSSKTQDEERQVQVFWRQKKLKYRKT